MTIRTKILVILIFCVGCSSDTATSDVKGWDLVPDGSIKDLGQKEIGVEDMPKQDVKTDQNPSVKTCENEDDLFDETNLDEAKGCEISLSSIFFVDYFETSVRGLDSLWEMGPRASLFFHRTPDLIDLNTFSNLEIINRNFEIQSAPVLVDLTGFKKLRRVEGRFELDSLPIKNFNGLQNLEYVGAFGFSAGELESFEGLEKLVQVEGELSIYAPKISEAQFRDFLKGKTIGGDITFQGEPFIR